MQKTIFLILVSFSLILISCEKKEEKAGLEIQPEENRLIVYSHNLDQFSSSTASGGAVKTSKIFESILLGSMHEETFGKTSAFIVSQFRLSSDNVDFGQNPQITSTQLFLDIDGYFGDTSIVSNIKVFESKYDLEIDSDSLLPSNIDMENHYGEILAEKSIAINPSEILSIDMSNEFGERILNSNNIEDNADFISEFKGLYFTVDTNQTSRGSIYKLDLNSDNSYILLTYNVTEDTTVVEKTFKLQFNNKCTRFNQFFNNTTNLTSLIDQPLSYENEAVYISGVGGLSGKLNLSPVYSWRDSSDIAIYKAELLFKAKTIEGFPTPSKLLLAKGIDEDNKITYVDDYRVGEETNYGGALNTDTDTYSIVITRHIQNLINNNHNDTIVEIIPFSKETNPHRVILKNGMENENVSLHITYSKLN